MFYTYALVADLGGSTNFSKSLGTSQTSTQTCTPFQGPRVITPHASTTASAAVSAKSIGKKAVASSAQTVPAVTKLKTAIIPKLLGASSPQVVVLHDPVSFNQTLPAGSTQVPALRNATPYHLIVACQQAALARATRSYVRIMAVFSLVPTPSEFTGEFTGEFGLGLTQVPGQGSRAALSHSFGHLCSTTSAQTARRNAGYFVIKSLSSNETTVLIKATGKALFAASVQVAAQALGTFSIRKATSGSAASVVRAMALLRGTASTQTAHAIVPTPRVRIMPTSSPQTGLLQRQIGAPRGMLSGNVAGLARMPGKLLAGSSGGTAALFKAPGKALGAANAAAQAMRKAMVTAKQVASSSLAGLQQATARLIAPLASVSTQSASVNAMRLRWVLVQGSSTQVATVLKLATHGIGKFVQSAQAQALLAVKAISIPVLNAQSANAAAVFKTPARLLGALSSLSAAAAMTIAHKILLPLASASVYASKASYSRRLAATSAETATVLRRRGTALFASSAASVTLQRGLSVSKQIVTVQVPLLALGISRTLTTITAETAALIRMFFRRPATSSTQVVTSVTRRGTSLIASFSASVAHLTRQTTKLLGATEGQATGIGRGLSRLFSTSQAQVAAMFRPRGVALRAVQAQVAAAAHWYWLWVAPWAYQQTTLLPPDGGLAEPPSFGPIDPADQTTFSFDWSARADVNDPIVSAIVTSVPSGLSFTASSPFISGLLVQATVVPFTAAQLPLTYSLRCTATFASGRRSSFSIPVPVQTL